MTEYVTWRQVFAIFVVILNIGLGALIVSPLDTPWVYYFVACLFTAMGIGYFKMVLDSV